MFPPVLPNARGLSYHHDPGRQSAPGGGTKKSGVVQPTKDRDYVGLLKALPNALHELLSNATYMLVSLGATMDGFLLAGRLTFRLNPFIHVVASAGRRSTSSFTRQQSNPLFSLATTDQYYLSQVRMRQKIPRGGWKLRP